MIRFDTRNKKPKVWNIAILTLLTAVLTAVLVGMEVTSLRAVEGVLCLYLLLTVAFLLRAFVRQLEYNPYSYNTIYYSGFALFAAAALITQISILVNTWRWGIWEAGSEDLLYQLSVLLGSAKRYMMISMPFIVLFSAALCISNIALIRHEGRRLVNLLGILLSLMMLGGEVLLYLSTLWTAEEWEMHIFYSLVTNLFAALYLYYECMLVGTIIANLCVMHYHPPLDRDYLIILGCGIRGDGTPTPLLLGRIEAAVSFYRKQLKETGRAPVLVASGGQGKDEVCSESASIKAQLLREGIPEEHILQEDRSESTYENMKFSKEVISQEKAKVAFATTNYHVFRSGLMARRVKMRAVGIGAKTKWYFWPNATVREFVGILTEHRVKQALILGGMIGLYTAMTLLYYL